MLQINCKDWEEESWANGLAGVMGVYIGEEEAKKVAAALLKKCERDSDRAMAALEEDEPGEDLCNCEFSLAYGR